MLPLVCAFLVVGAATLALLFVLPRRPPLSTSWTRRALVAAVVAGGSLLLALLVDRATSTLVYRVPDGLAADASPRLAFPFVLFALFAFAVLLERAVAWSAVPAKRARAAVLAAMFGACALAAPFVLVATSAGRDLDPLATWSDATSVPSFFAHHGLVMDLEHENCEQAPRVDFLPGARSAHPCTMLDGHFISQISVAVPLTRSGEGIRVPEQEPPWLARICTRRGDSGETRCVVAILDRFEPWAVIDDRAVPEAQRIGATEVLKVHFDSRLAAWILCADEVTRTPIHAVILDGATLGLRTHDVGTRELVGEAASISRRWLGLLVPAAVGAAFALLALLRSLRARRDEERARELGRAHANANANANAAYRHAEPSEADELRARSLEEQLSKRSLRDERLVLASFALAAAGALPLFAATLLHAFDRFPTEELGVAARTLPSLPDACAPSMELFDGSQGVGTPVPFCIDRDQVTAAAYQAKRHDADDAPERDDDRICHRVANGGGDAPMNCLTAESAAAYCASLGRELASPSDLREQAVRIAARESRYSPISQTIGGCSPSCPRDLSRPLSFEGARRAIGGSLDYGFRCRIEVSSKGEPAK